MTDAGRPGHGEPAPTPASKPTFSINVPPELETGQYANFLSVWHGPHDFTLDFAVTGQGRETEPGKVTVPCQVVARVKIPLTVAEDMLRALATHLNRFEEVAGRIRKPGDDLPRGRSSG